MNVVEAYIKNNKKLLIFISGLHPGSGKSEISKNINRDFKINCINQKDYISKNYKNKVKLPNGKEVINYDSDDSIDWDKFNKDIKKLQKKGLVVNGMSFNKDKIKVKPDFHIHLSISKKNNLLKRKELIENDKKYSNMDYDEIKLVMNQLTYPYYLETLNKSNINKFINTNKYNQEQVYDQVFDSLMEFIFDNLYKDRKDKPKYKKQFDESKKYESSSDTDELPNESSEEQSNDNSEKMEEIINSQEQINEEDDDIKLLESDSEEKELIETESNKDNDLIDSQSDDDNKLVESDDFDDNDIENYSDN